MSNRTYFCYVVAPVTRAVDLTSRAAISADTALAARHAMAVQTGTPVENIVAILGALL